MTNSKNYVKIDTDKYVEIKPPGLDSPKKAISYHHPQVQHIISGAFSGLFPSIVQSEEGIAYQLLDQKGFDRCVKSQPAKNISDIPKPELLRLMEGWIRLRRRLQDEELGKSIQSILLNFRVPDPRTAIEHYRIEKIGDTKRLIVFWGFETAKKPCVPLERALSLFLDVPTGHLQSILSTSMSPNTAGVMKTAKMDPEVLESLSDEMKKEVSNGSKVVVVKEKQNLKVLVPVLLLCGGLLAGLAISLTRGGEKQEVLRVIDREEKMNAPSKPPEVIPESIAVSKKIEVKEPIVEVEKGNLIVEKVETPIEKMVPVKVLTNTDLIGEMLSHQENKTEQFSNSAQDLLSQMISPKSKTTNTKNTINVSGMY